MMLLQTNLGKRSPKVRVPSKKVAKKAAKKIAKKIAKKVARGETLTKKQIIDEHIAENFTHSFDVGPKAIELNDMGKNYDHAMIPMKDIHEILLLELEKKPLPRYSYDPSHGTFKEINKIYSKMPKGTIHRGVKYVLWHQLFLCSFFQRALNPNGCKKLEKGFDHGAGHIALAIKITINGKVYYCVWDGQHTLQASRLVGYNRFGIKVTDIDAVPMSVINEKFNSGDDEQDRIDYAMWYAGTKFIEVNLDNKNDLQPYDIYFIQVNIKDPDTLRLKKVLDAAKCTVSRESKGLAGSLSQINMARKALEDYGDKHLERALKICRATWPDCYMELEVWRPLAKLFKKAADNGFTLNKTFDKNIGSMLKKKIGIPENVQLHIKGSCEYAMDNRLSHGKIPKNNTDTVVDGLINFCNQEFTQKQEVQLPAPSHIWDVMDCLKKAKKTGLIE